MCPSLGVWGAEIGVEDGFVDGCPGGGGESTSRPTPLTPFASQAMGAISAL